ncbi:unnamed protein product, partial [Symbiodinium microadriaticum]
GSGPFLLGEFPAPHEADDKESLGDSPERQARDAELDSISWAILEPLPPGWQMGDMARSRRLHPFLDVFDDDPAADDPEPEQDYHEDEEAGTCDASVLPVPFHFDTGEIPGRSGSPAAEHDLNAADDAPPSPVGPPPTLSAQQRARLHALLQQRDEQGHTPFGVDDYHTDTAKWAAYSKGELPRTPKAPASSRNLDQRPTAGSRPELQKGTFSTPSTTHGGSPLPRGGTIPNAAQLSCELSLELEAPIMAIPPFGPCCHNASFMPFLPISFTDTELEPVLIPPAPCLGKIKPGGIVMTALPSALPEAQGFVALVADAPINIDPSEGARLPGFGDQLTQLSCWRIPVATPSAPRRAVRVGFEYFCPQGHRFMAPPPKCSGLVVADPELSRPRRSRRRKDGYRDGQPPATPAVMDESG